MVASIIFYSNSSKSWQRAGKSHWYVFNHNCHRLPQDSGLSARQGVLGHQAKHHLHCSWQRIWRHQSPRPAKAWRDVDKQELRQLSQLRLTISAQSWRSYQIFKPKYERTVNLSCTETSNAASKLWGPHQHLLAPSRQMAPSADKKNGRYVASVFVPGPLRTLHLLFHSSSLKTLMGILPCFALMVKEVVM